MTRFELHVESWSDCQRCDYSQRRKRVVLGKGELPCEILIVGEAPGGSEDVAGVPMVAQAGRLMDRMLIKAGIVKANTQGFIWEEGGTPAPVWKHTVSITNLIGCIPLTLSREKEEPDIDCVTACKPRLQEWIEFANPKLIITAGKPAEEWFDQTWKEAIKTSVPLLHTVHPSAILRKPFVERSVAVQREVVRIQIAIRDYVVGKSKEEVKKDVPTTTTEKKQPGRDEREVILDKLEGEFVPNKHGVLELKTKRKGRG